MLLSASCHLTLLMDALRGNLTSSGLPYSIPPSALIRTLTLTLAREFLKKS